MRPFIDLTGRRFGRLTVLERRLDGVKGRTERKCICDCGNILNVSLDRLRIGKTKSCGCLQKELLSIRRKKHGMTLTRIFHIWRGMKARCYNKNEKCYHRYGGRGINVCSKRLDGFEYFKDDMYESYLIHSKIFGEKNTTIDRIDNDGDYCKNNCKRSTYKEQANNRSNNVLTPNVQ